MTEQELAQACAEAMYARDLASQALGITLEHVEPGAARLAMTVTDNMVNGHGICHGGYIFLLADSAFAFACNTYNLMTVAQSAAVEFVAPVYRGDELVATANETTRFGRNGLYDIRVERDGGTVAVFHGRSRSLGRPVLEEDGK
ncbi:MAG: hydroxyphenylacetyl-CoA thioesterase PaaI [Ferrimicrobium sp.]|uniref:Hydroxyphenylacetyl-CoA thioesterase PaaI n=1 Tax=Ferrimicrobium acidiphilum TaxID=121039 RepID=A0ABV3Y0C8_9ACTN|nr:hydroxyphenylacetyl-CoA thioesterase PaaI [Ferrimicrobium sp.]